MEINKESEANEMEDSGFVQDEVLKKKNLDLEQQDMLDTERCPLLDLSDELLLYILRYLKPRDLKALGFTCGRLGSLVLDRSLWTVVDATGEEVGSARLEWYLTHALSEHTRELRLRGYAAGVDGCKGAVSCTRAEYMQIEEDAKELSEMLNPKQNGAAEGGDAADPSSADVERRFLMSNEEKVECILPAGAPCRGTQYTVDEPLLRRLGVACPNLTTLALDHCNIDGGEVKLRMFPRTLKRLSLRGSRVYNQTSDEGFLYHVSSHLPDLEFIDVSECGWMAPLMLMGLGKLQRLRELRAARCRKMIEFVAYASLAARGFPSLLTLDLRGSPVGNSEVSAWAPVGTLRALHLSAPPPAPARRPRRHAHYRDEQRAPRDELAPWETQEPPYYKVDDCGASKGAPAVTGYVDCEGAWVDLASGHVDYGHNYVCPAECPRDRMPERLRREGDERRGKAALRRGAEESSSTLQNENGNAGKSGSGSEKDSGNENGSNRRKSDDCEPYPSGVERTQPDMSLENGIPVERAGGSVSASGSGSVGVSESGSGIRSVSDSSSKRKTEDTEPGPSSGKRNCTVVAEGNGTPDRCLGENTSGSVNGSGSDSSKRRNFDTESDPSNAKRSRPDAIEENESGSGSGSVSGSGSGSGSGDGSSGTRNRFPRHGCVIDGALGARVSCACPAAAARPPAWPWQLVPAAAVSTVYLSMMARNQGLHPADLVSDVAIQRFGYSDQTDQRYVTISRRGIAAEHRRERSGLIELTVSGYRQVTDRTLTHLSTAAPHLRYLDVRGTGVTAAGVDSFKCLRPECQVLYTPPENGSG